jgi:hypothetical protein
MEPIPLFYRKREEPRFKHFGSICVTREAGGHWNALQKAVGWTLKSLLGMFNQVNFL